jgi:hypothetical protein
MTDKAAQIDAIIERQEEALKSAVLSALKAMNKSATHANIRNYQTAKKALEDYQTKAGETTGERFKNIEQASSWIIGQGYLVSPRTVRNHAEKMTGFPRKQKDGSYLQTEMAVYASATWENPGKPATETLTNGAGRDELVAEQVRKLRLANEITEGNYILRSLVEQEFSARASYLKRDLFNLGPRFVDRMMDKLSTLLKECGLPVEEINIHALVPDMEAYWDLKVAEHLHEYSKARGFIPEPVKGIDE